MNETTETDLVWKDMNIGNYQPSWWFVAEKMRDHAKRMERERDEARREQCSIQCAFEESQDKIEELERERDEWAAMCGRYKQERDELLQKLDAWKEISELLHHFVNYPANGVEQAIQRVEVLEAYKHLTNEKTTRR